MSKNQKPVASDGILGSTLGLSDAAARILGEDLQAAAVITAALIQRRSFDTSPARAAENAVTAVAQVRAIRAALQEVA